MAYSNREETMVGRLRAKGGGDFGFVASPRVRLRNRLARPGWTTSREQRPALGVSLLQYQKCS